MKRSNYDKFPEIRIEGHTCMTGWQHVAENIKKEAAKSDLSKFIVVVECYHGVDTTEIKNNLGKHLPSARVLESASAFRNQSEVNKLVEEYVTEDPVFGFITPLELHAFLDDKKIEDLKSEIEQVENGIVVVLGIGATLIYSDYNLLVYADMPRWEIQLRFRKQVVGNMGVENHDAEFAYKYKRSFFVDWRVCDKHKRTLLQKWDYLLDTTIADEPKLITGHAFREALSQTVKRPFRVVPFFDPGPWGGQWLKEVCDLDRSVQNFAWGFDCVPEENSLRYKFNGGTVEIPAVDLVFSHPQELLGNQVYSAFGAEFPIRFDFLDTMEGGNLSLQVHPLKEYIQDKFGMTYTQDESYYFLEAKEDAFVYLGMKEKVEPERMVEELKAAQENGGHFEAEKYVQKWPISKHDHVLIPAGTVHCSGADSVVLEISATPYIFTFKLWDWGRMGLDGKPRPISIDHGKNVIQWDRTPEWTQENILNKVEPVTEGDGWREERTGLDEGSFIETRRHWFTKKVLHHTNGVVNVLNLVEGPEAVVESPKNAFDPFIIHYAETFILPAAVGEYTVRPYGEGEGRQCATIKASVRIPVVSNSIINTN